METAVSYPHPVNGGRSHSRANSLFAQARKRARRAQFLSKFSGRSRRLYALKEIETTCAVEDRRNSGVRPVAIRQIRGSEGRSNYFDRDFHPLHDQARGRWLNIAKARQQGKHLPPVVLVQVGDFYFVQDGHHRISVARALGASHIDARVTVWQVAGTLPWEEPAQQPGIGRTLRGRLAAAGI
jgi:hypothetical protein